MTNYLYFGDLTFDYANFALAKSGSASFISPQLSIPLAKPMYFENDIDLGTLSISVIDSGGILSTRENGEREAKLTYDAKFIYDEDEVRIDTVTSIDARGREFDAKAWYTSGSGTKISSAEVGITNNTVEYNNSTTTLEINFLDILDDFAVSKSGFSVKRLTFSPSA